jgi:hypothetical protein
MEARKVDLLSFQKNLNEQFIEIFKAKKQGNIQFVESVKLGLQTEVFNYKFFISLKDLQNISMNNIYEESKLLTSWICGFNQIRGEVFTILDFKKTINFLLNRIADKQYKKLDIDNRIVYLKEYYDEKIGLILESFDLVDISEFISLFKSYENENKKYWKFNEDLNFESFLKEENMSKEEFEILKCLLNIEIIKEYSEENQKEIFFYLFNDIYLDVLTKRPIFVLNIENLTKILINISLFQ